MADRKPSHLLSTTKTAEDTRRWYWNNHDKAKRLKREAMQRRRLANPQHHRNLGLRFRINRRSKLLDLYGTSCVICGFADRRALTLDHIQRNGKAERDELGEQGIYSKAIREFRPDLYRTLCMNCQFIERSK